MNNKSIMESTNNNKVSVITNDLDATIHAFEKIKEVATYLATSEAFTKGFEIRDKDGNVIIDENTGKPKINIADVALCLMTGHELGLNMGGSLLYGKKLNQSTYMSIMKGKGLGVDIATAIEKIITIPSKNGNTVSYTMVDIISAKLMQNQITFLPFIKNYAPYYIYRDADRNELELDKILDKDTDNLLDKYEVVNLSDTPDNIKIKVKEIKDAGKIVITKEQHGYYTKAKFTRKYPDGNIVVHYQRFSTLDAERAGLLPTYGSDANDKNKIVLLSPGKDNWINNTPQMLANRVISIGGRIIGADLLNGIYTREEVVSAGIVSENDAPIVDAVIV